MKTDRHIDEGPSGGLTGTHRALLDRERVLSLEMEPLNEGLSNAELLQAVRAHEGKS